MNAKKLVVSFLAVALMLTLVATVSAASDVAKNVEVKLNDENAGFNDLTVVAGETVSIRVAFNSLVNTSDVTVKAEIEGTKVDVSGMSAPFDVESGKRYSKTLTLEVPYELKDDLSENIVLTVTCFFSGFQATARLFVLLLPYQLYNWL